MREVKGSSKAVVHLVDVGNRNAGDRFAAAEESLSGDFGEKAVNLHRPRELEPAKVREPVAVTKSIEAAPALIVSGEEPPDDGLTCQERARQRFAIAVPEDLAAPDATHRARYEAA